ncbi:MAG: DUF2017 domain-containing protein [Nocardioidaceae bacterium]
MSQFRARRKGGVQAELPAEAAGLLNSLVRQLIELLSDGEPLDSISQDPLEALLDLDAPREPPLDPALLRLLPTAHREDEEVASEFRRFTERGLREGKVRDARVVLESLGEIGDESGELVEFELDAQQARAWLRCLTDLRLTLAERLGVTAEDEEFWTALPDDDPRVPVHEIFGWLGYLLESLVDVVRR